MKADVIREASEFAERQGKIAIPISTNETPMAVGQFASFDYQFRVVDKNDPEAKRTALVPRANVVVEKTEKISADLRTKEEKTPDLYTELQKLKALKDEGVLSEEEFARAKQKLLSEK